MSIWCKSEYDYQLYPHTLTGLFFRFDQDVDPDVRRAILLFGKWIRTQYVFPARVIVYVKSTLRVRARDGDMVYSVCWRPGNMEEYPVIRMATGDYPQLLANQGRDNALASILFDIAQNLTHYFQWLKEIDYQSERQEEIQAERCANRILDKYALTTDHP